MFLHTNGPHSRPPTSMWDAEGFVEVEMTNISSNKSWACQSNLQISVVLSKVLSYLQSNKEYRETPCINSILQAIPEFQ